MTISQAKTRLAELQARKPKIYADPIYRTTQGKAGWQTVKEVDDRKREEYRNTCNEIKTLEAAVEKFHAAHPEVAR